MNRHSMRQKKKAAGDRNMLQHLLVVNIQTLSSSRYHSTLKWYLHSTVFQCPVDDSAACLLFKYQRFEWVFYSHNNLINYQPSSPQVPVQLHYLKAFQHGHPRETHSMG